MHRGRTRGSALRHSSLSRVGTNLVVALLLFVVSACTTEPAPPAPTPPAFARAEHAFQRGEYARAGEAYRSFLAHPDDDAYVPRAWYKLALCQYRQQEYRETLATLDELANAFPNQAWPQSAALRGDTHQALGNRLSALAAWAEAWHAGDEKDRAALRPRIGHVIANLSAAERERAGEVTSEPAIRAWIEQPPSVAPAPPAAAPQSASPVAAAATGTPARPAVPEAAKIACLLPLSGPHRAFGERSLDGIRLALGNERLVVKDTHGSPEAAVAAFNELAARADIVAVIGPLRSNVASAVAPLAESAQLPLLLLAQREGLTSRWVLQPAMTRRQQAVALVTHALRVHWRQFGILAPNDKYGREFGAMFRTAVEAGGGQVSWSESYDTRTHDIAQPTVRARARRAQGALDAIFVPDDAAAAIAVGTALRGAIPGIGLLGPNDWNDPPTLARAGTALDGAVFAAGFFADSARQPTRAFVEAFRKAHDTTPDIFAAQAYDGAAILREALQRGGVTRGALLDTLPRLGSVAGASGSLRVGESGVERDLFLLRLVGGRVEEVENAQ